MSQKSEVPPEDLETGQDCAEKLVQLSFMAKRYDDTSNLVLSLKLNYDIWQIYVQRSIAKSLINIVPMSYQLQKQPNNVYYKRERSS